MRRTTLEGEFSSCFRSRCLPLVEEIADQLVAVYERARLYGHPIAPIHVVHEPDPHGPGFRKTVDFYLAMDYGDRITDDLRCRECGAEAMQTHLMTPVGIGPNPVGRRVCVV